MITCYRKGYGYIAEKQNFSSIYLTYTENVDEARLYKTNRTAARGHNFKSDKSKLALEELIFNEIN